MCNEPSRQIAELKQGDHRCLLYETEAEQRAAVVPFIREGLTRGQRCAHIAGDRDAQEIAGALAAVG